MTETHPDAAASQGLNAHDVVDWSDLGKETWSYLVRGDGSRLVISTSDANGLVRVANLGAARPLAAVRSARRCADALAREGLSVSLVGARGTIVELGRSHAYDREGAPARQGSIRLGRVRDGYPWFVLESALILAAHRCRRHLIAAAQSSKSNPVRTRRPRYAITA